jgi:hypothetical protein
MAISQPTLRARILPRFPANVLAGTGITITKSGGTYTFAVQAYADIPVTALAHIPADRLLGRDTSGDGPVEVLSAGSGIGFNGVGSLELTSNQRIRAVAVMFPTVTVGAQMDVLVPFGCIISRFTMMANAVGSVVVDVWKDTFANFPPTAADTVVGVSKPTITLANKMQDSTLTGWNTAILAGDILRFNIDSVTTITRLSIGIDVVTL